jgi:hypothetical protein
LIAAERPQNARVEFGIASDLLRDLRCDLELVAQFPKELKQAAWAEPVK